MRLTLQALPVDERKLLFAMLRASEGRAATALEIQRALDRGILLETTIKGVGWPFGTSVDVPAFHLSPHGTDLLVVGETEIEEPLAPPGPILRPSSLAAPGC